MKSNICVIGIYEIEKNKQNCKSKFPEIKDPNLFIERIYEGTLENLS